MVLAAGLLLLSCSEKPVGPPVPEEPDPVLNEIKITADFGAPSKASSENGLYKSFETGDAISVFVWTGEHASGSLALEQTVVNNVLNRFEGASKWKADGPMSWSDGEPEAHDFMAVYPAVELKMPGTLQGSYSAVDGRVEDVLVARVTDQIPTSEPVRLTFDHAMSCLEVNLTVRSEYAGIDPSSIYVTAEVATDAVVDYVDVSSYATGTETDYRLSASSDGLLHRAVLPAQTLPMNIVVHLGEASLTLKRDGLDLVLESGNRTTINLKVGKDKVELASGGISIGDWDTPEEWNGSVETE